MRQLNYLVLVFLATSLDVFAQEQIEWDETRSLTVNDFKATPPESSMGHSLIANFGIEISLDKAEVSGLSNYNGQIRNVFSASDSWVDWTDKSRITYANTLFNINEWKARELRKRLNANRKVVAEGRYHSIVEQVEAEFARIREDYGNQTGHGNDLVAQMRWETRISKELMILADYCRSCAALK